MIKKLSIILFAVLIYSCEPDGTAMDKITLESSVNDRLAMLNESTELVKSIEDNDALTRDHSNFLEYDYPIGEKDSYTISYFFNEKGCNEIKLNTYFTQPVNAKKVKIRFRNFFNNNERFMKSANVNDQYIWYDKDNTCLVVLDYNHEERGIIKISFTAN